MRYLNKGNIPEKTICPFHKNCGFKDNNCPTSQETVKDKSIHCPVAHYMDIRLPTLAAV